VKLLLFSDLHCDTKAAQHLVERAAANDVIIGAGDFANARRGIELCIDVLKQIDQPTVLVPGNNESYEELARACRGWPSATVLHGTSVELSGVSFFGIGGGIPVTPFGPWSYDFSEDQAAKLLKNCAPGSVLISHSPPSGAVDLSSSGRNLGSAAVLNAIKSNSPRLVVCGHVHRSAGQHVAIGKSIVVNAGPAGVEWELPVA
jgi:Icc-related predicted phosphoesterase